MNRHDMIRAINVMTSRSQKLNDIVSEEVRNKNGFDKMSDQDINELLMFCQNYKIY